MHVGDGLFRLDRRRFGTLLASAAIGIPGCLGPPTERETDSSTPGSSGPAASVADVDLPIPRSELRQALRRDSIRAIADPTFASDWSGVAAAQEQPAMQLSAGDPVVGVVRDETARAYPLRVLGRQEVVNDVFDGPILVTYCPLCGSSVVATRTIDGEVTLFGVSGYLWREDLVMYDRATESLWSQLLATAINGPRTGVRLRLVPSTLTSLGEWWRQHPGTEVRLPPPHSGLLDGVSPRSDVYVARGGTDRPQLIGAPGETADGLSRSTLVVGITHAEVAPADPYPAVAAAGVVNDDVAGLPVVVTTTPGGSLAA